jgi:hypothetical protein
VLQVATKPVQPPDEEDIEPPARGVSDEGIESRRESWANPGEETMRIQALLQNF